MLEIFRYSHIVAKVSAMRGKLLKASDYEALLQQKTVKDAALFLKNKTYYGESLKKLDENNVHRGTLEMLLNYALFQDELKIFRYLKKENMVSYAYRKQEIEDIKKMLRFLHMGKSIESLDKQMFSIMPYNHIDFDKLYKANNIRELVEGLKDTEYYVILNPLVVDEDTIDLFNAEMALDMYYYKKIEEQINGMQGRNKAILKELFGLEADMKNILWIYRGKKYYQIPKEILYRYLIPYYHKLTKKHLTNMIEAKSVEAFLELVIKTKYAFDVEGDKIKKEKTFIEKQQQGYKKSRRSYPFSLAPISDYLFNKEVEVANITTIIEGIRYQVQPEEIRKLVIGL